MKTTEKIVNEFFKEFFALSEEEQKAVLASINTKQKAPPLPVIYKKEDGAEEALSEIIPSRVKEIIGILCGDKGVLLKNEDNNYFNNAHACALKRAEEMKLPLELPRHFDGDTGIFFGKKEKFSETVKLLQEYGVNAELWKDGCYRCFEEYNENDAYEFNMSNGRVGIDIKVNVRIYVRLVWTFKNS